MPATVILRSDQQGKNMIADLLWSIYFKFINAQKWWKELDDFHALPPDAARTDMAHRLLNQMRYFGARSDALQEWREAAKIKDPSVLWKIWAELPIIERKDLQSRFHPNEMQERFGLKGVSSSTGGSTGEPTPFLHDNSMLQANRALGAYCRRKFGWRPGMPTLIIWGSERDIGKTQSLKGKILYQLSNFRIVDGYDMSDNTIDQVLDFVNNHRQSAVYGFTSMLEFVAGGVLSRKIAPRRGKVAAAWNGGEMLFETQSAIFEQAFGVAIQNYYGSRDLGAMAYQAYKMTGLRVLRPSLFLEIVDDNGKPVKIGEVGRLVWTSTVCRGTPFIRYANGDMGVYHSDGADTSGIHTINELHGRDAGILKLPNGRSINCIYWNHLLKDFPEVIQFQVVLSESRGITLRLIGNGFSEERQRLLISTIRSFIGMIPVTLSWVDSIKLTKQGKLIQVVREA